MKPTNNSILFYDGECGFCNRSVQFVLKHEKIPSIQFSKLQSDFARSTLDKFEVTVSMETLYYLKKGVLYERSSAALHICKTMVFPYKLAYYLIVIPKSIRDFFYNTIAKNRHKINKGFCVIPKEHEKDRFIS